MTTLLRRIGYTLITAAIIAYALFMGVMATLMPSDFDSGVCILAGCFGVASLMRLYWIDT